MLKPTLFYEENPDYPGQIAVAASISATFEESQAQDKNI
jgi:hypothetical protein